MFDRAPSVPYDEVEGVFMRDIGQGPDEIFEEFGHTAMASASIAQVHRATLKPGQGGAGGAEGEGKKVAVKVQKPAIEKQMEWDLFSYRCAGRVVHDGMTADRRSLMWLCEKIFDMPSESL